MSRSPILTAPLAAALLLSSGLALAHEAGLSTAFVEVRADVIEATLEIDEAALRGAALDASALGVETDGRAGRVLGMEPLASRPGHSAVRLRYSRPAGSRLRVTSRILSALPFGHKQLLRVRRDGSPAGADRLLSAGAASVELELSGAF